MKNTLKQTLQSAGINYTRFSKTEQDILNKIYSKKNGTYFKIQYYTDINDKVSAYYRDRYNVTKLTTISIRKGIDYNKTKKVQNRRKGKEYTPKNTFFYHIDKTLLKNKKEDKYYIGAFLNIYGKPNTLYMVNGRKVTYEQLKEMGIMQPSFWGKKGEKPDFITIGLDKITEVY